MYTYICVYIYIIYIYYIYNIYLYIKYFRSYIWLTISSFHLPFHLRLNPFGLRVDMEGWWFEHSMS